LVRFIGVTGHGLRIAAMHRRSIERFEFDSVLLPWNFPLSKDAEYRAEVEALLGTCAERSIAVQTIKSVARRRWAPDYDGRRFSWYEPLPEGAALERAVRFVLADQQLFLNTSSDLRLLRPTLQAAGAGSAPPAVEELERDSIDLGLLPLFDGSDLERI
jgi:hypothetical protein